MIAASDSVTPGSRMFPSHRGAAASSAAMASANPQRPRARTAVTAMTADSSAISQVGSVVKGALSRLDTARSCSSVPGTVCPVTSRTPPTPVPLAVRPIRTILP